MSNNNHDEATLSLQYFSIHLNMSFPANRTLRTNFNVIHTLVFESAHDYKNFNIWCGQNLMRFLTEQNTFFECSV